MRMLISVSSSQFYVLCILITPSPREKNQLHKCNWFSIHFNIDRKTHVQTLHKHIKHFMNP